MEGDKSTCSTAYRFAKSLAKLHDTKTRQHHSPQYGYQIKVFHITQFF